MFDPTLPIANTSNSAAQMRAQLNGLKALIDAVPTVTGAQVDGTNTLPPGTPANANVSRIGNTLHFTFGLPQGQEGLAGQDGAPGPAFAQAVVDSVTTLNPWESASVNVSFDGSYVRFTFAIPRGYDGSQGPPGSNGGDGNQGAQGNQGPPFALAVVDGVTTLDPGQPASVQTSFDGSNVRFTFGIPRGQDGANGSNGNDGAQGPAFAQAVVDNVTTLEPGQPASVQTSFDGNNVRFTFGIPRGSDGSNGTNGTDGTSGGNGSDGAQGPPGEVSLAMLNSAISGTSNNTNSVSTLDTGFADSDMESLRQKLNELIQAARR
jgi:hypothetical protein